MSLLRFKYLFQQFVTNRATPEERKEFLLLVNSHTYDEDVQSMLDELWQNPSSFADVEADKAERIFNQIVASEKPVRGNIYFLKNSWVKLAAAVVVIAGVSVIFYQNSSERAGEIVNNSIEVQPLAASLRRFINLPDGSSVILNENSKLELSENFGKGNREVSLKGEAYFDIVHDKSNPFIVHTGEVRTTVLGTVFNVNASPGNETVTVTVKRGKVRVGDNDHIFNVIDPNEQLVFNSETTTHTKRPVEAGAVTAWTAGDIYFDDVSLKDVANQLQERFNISILFSNEQIKDCRFSATFLKTQSLDHILNIIGEFNQIKYHFRNKDSVILDGIGCG